MTKILDQLFPLREIRNVALYYVLSAIYTMIFASAVWIFIWGRFMSNVEIGISDAITFALGFLVELPSGVMADVIGRKKAIVIGNILLTIGNLLVGLSSSFMGITWWYLVWTIGYAFQSGATEALVYDTVKKKGFEDEWPRVIATATIVSRCAILMAATVGGLLYTIWFRLPYMAAAASGIIGIAAAFSLDEILVKRHGKWSVGMYVSQVKDGLTTLIKPQVFPIALLCMSVAGIAYMYNWGLLRPLTAQRFGFSPVAYAYLLSAISLVGILAISLFARVKQNIQLERFIFIVGLLFTFIFFSLGLPHRWVIGGSLMILLTVMSIYNDVSFSQFINRHTREEHRATTLSAVALFTKLPYVLLAILIGKLADDGLIATYTLIVGVVALGIWLISFILQRRQLRKLIQYSHDVTR